MPFAFWPMAPAVPRGWLEFLDFASTRADGTWLFRGHADASPELVPAIGRQSSAAAYRRADEQILFDEFVREAGRYIDGSEFSDFEWLALAHHHGVPTRLLEWTTNPLVAAWFAAQDEPSSVDGEILAIRVPHVRRVHDAPIFAAGKEPVVIVQVPPRIGRVTGQQGCFSLHADPVEVWTPSVEAYDFSSVSVPQAEKADFLRLLHIFGQDAHGRARDLNGLGATLAWRFRQR